MDKKLIKKKHAKEIVVYFMFSALVKIITKILIIR